MAGRSHKNHIKILFEILYKEFQNKIVSEIVDTLCQHNSANKFNLKLGKYNTRDAITEEAKNISSSEYVPCFKEIYKKLSSIIYSHHCMTRFHSEYKTHGPHLKALRGSENKEMQKLLINSKDSFWKTIQSKVIEVFQSTTNFFFNLSVRELFEILSLTNKFIEIGLEFAKPNECVLQDEVISLCNRYMLDFKETQFNNLRDFISNEEWVRLPLPDNYEVKEFRELLRNYPPNFKRRIRIFQSHFGRNLSEYSSKSIFAKFCDGNPFDFDDLDITEEMSTPAPDKKKSQKLPFSQHLDSYYKHEKSKKKHQSRAPKKKSKRNPFSHRNHTDINEETKEENLADGIDEGVTIHKDFEGVDPHNHTEIFYQHINIVSQNIVISSSGLNLVKAFFKYVELLNVLNSFSFEILIGITQMFEFYVFSVFFLYASEESTKLLFEDSFHSKIAEFSHEISGSKSFQSKLNQLQNLHSFQEKYSTLKSEMIRIEDCLKNQFKSKMSIISRRKLICKLLDNSSIYDTMDTKQCSEIFKESVIAVESVHFIYECLSKLKDKIMESINVEHKSYLIDFYDKFEKLIGELRQFIYEEKCQTVIKIEPIIDSVKGNDWSLTSYRGFKSPYIEKILQSVMKCEQSISNEGIGVFPKYVIDIILFHLVCVLSKAILRGYSSVRKCTEEGRKVMEKDIKDLKSDLTTYTGKDLPCFDEILRYLQQYYYYPAKILKFIKVNPQLEISHAMGLIQTAPEIQKLKKNELKNIVSRIEDFYVQSLSAHT